MLLDRARKGELYYVDDNGRRQDASLHEEILSEGDDARAQAVSDKIKEAILSKARGHLPEEPVVPPKEPKKTKDAWNPDQPREPAGSPEGGQFASISGGGISGGATGGPVAPAKKLFTPSSDKAHHEKRVSDTLLNPVKRNDNYRYIVSKLVEEAKSHGANAGVISDLRTKIGESYYKQGLLKKEKGQEATAQAMFHKGKSYGYNPTVAEALASMAAPKPVEDPSMAAVFASLKAAPEMAAAEKAHAEEIAAKPPSAATIPVAQVSWIKVGPQKGSVGGGTYAHPADPDNWYVKTPKTEAHVNADLLSNQLYKLAGVSVSHQVKTVLEGKSAVASKIISNVKTLAQASDLQKQAAHQALRESFAVDAWLGNRDVVGEGFDNVVVQGFQTYRLDQGGTLMYRAQGETKEFGTSVGEIVSMRNPNINAQTASVFGSMTPAEVSASIDKVLAVSEADIMKTATAHGMPGVAATLIARRAYLAQYQKTLNVSGEAPPAEQPAWAAKLEQQTAAMKAAAQPKPTAAELEKAKKVGPYYPAPTSEMGKSVVKYFNEKWATTAPTPEQLEEKVADYKNAKAALEAVQAEEASAAEKAAAATKAEQAAKLKAEKAAAKAKEQAESAAYQEQIAKLAAEIGLNPSDAEQVDTLIHLAGGDKAKIIQQFKAFQESGKGKHGLPITPFESAMIQSYVGSGYGSANAALREGAWDMKIHVFAKGIQSALVKLPAYNKTLKRGFTADLSDQKKYKVGKIVRWDAFSSCGKSDSFGGNMQCTITPLPGPTTRARDLGPMNPSEAGGEVLYMAHSSFKVTKVQHSPNGTMHVWLEEVEPFH